MNTNRTHSGSHQPQHFKLHHRFELFLVREAEWAIRWRISQRRRRLRGMHSAPVVKAEAPTIAEAIEKFLHDLEHGQHRKSATLQKHRHRY